MKLSKETLYNLLKQIETLKDISDKMIAFGFDFERGPVSGLFDVQDKLITELDKIYFNNDEVVDHYFYETGIIHHGEITYTLKTIEDVIDYWEKEYG